MRTNMVSSAQASLYLQVEIKLHRQRKQNILMRNELIFLVVITIEKALISPRYVRTCISHTKSSALVTNNSKCF